MRPMTVGQLRETLAQIGKGHDDKQVAVLDYRGNVVYLSACAAVQNDRVLFEAADRSINPKGK